MSCRYDKFVWAVRLAKTRSLAADLISGGKIQVNAAKIKPSREVKVHDIISVFKNSAEFKYQVLQVVDKRMGAKLVGDYLQDITDPQEIEKLKLYLAAQSVYREYGTGKPSKKDRRDLDDFLDAW